MEEEEEGKEGGIRGREEGCMHLEFLHLVSSKL